MERFNEIKEFISIAHRFMLPQTQANLKEEFEKRQTYNRNRYSMPELREKIRESQKKYEKSPKGRIQKKKKSAHYCIHRRLRHSSRKYTREEFKKIRDFYFNRPEGYHIDHIIPIAVGGEHILENLQYLSPDENLRKKKYIVTTDMKVQLLRNRFIRKL